MEPEIKEASSSERSRVDDGSLTKKYSSADDQKLQGSLTFAKRQGTTDRGGEFEKYVVTYFVLKCLDEKTVADFRVWSNDNNFGAFDDVILQIKSKNGLEEHYAIQLKHVNNRERSLQLTDLQKGEKGNFSIKKYFKSYKQVKSSLTNYTMILWTNANFPSPEQKFDWVDEQSTFTLQIVECEDLPFLSMREGTKWYKFKILNGTPNSVEYKEFFDRFRLCTNQKHVDDLKEDVSDFVSKKLYCEKSFLNNLLDYFDCWTVRENEVYKLDREIMEKVVALKLLDDYIYPFSSETVCENVLFQNTLNKFDVTVFEEECLENVCKIWKNDKEILSQNKQKVDELLLHYNLLSKHPELDKIDETLCSKLLWLMGEQPLIVRESPSTYKAIELCRGQKFILIGENTDCNTLSKLTVFRSYRI